jgi:formylglycine-generating enzyme
MIVAPSAEKLHEADVDRRSMIWIPGGTFLMGSDRFYREERPARRETVQGFWVDSIP